MVRWHLSGHIRNSSTEVEEHNHMLFWVYEPSGFCTLAVRWAHPTERDGLQQVFQSAAPNPPPPWDLVKELGDKGDARPRMAMTEFSPDVFSVRLVSTHFSKQNLRV